MPVAADSRRAAVVLDNHCNATIHDDPQPRLFRDTRHAMADFKTRWFAQPT